MDFEWDEEKAADNLAKHGVSFDTANSINWSAALTIDQTVGGERRYGVFAPLGDRLHYCVYADRGGARRIISLSKANQREIRAYQEAMP